MSAAISPQAFARLPPYIQFQIIHHDDDRSATLEVVGVRLEIDDWTIVAALMFMVGFFVTQMLMVFKWGQGLHAAVVGEATIIEFAKGIFISNIFYALAVFFVKYSILALYHRIFVVRRFLIVVKCSLVFLVLFQVASIIVSIFACAPIRSNWDTVPGMKCIDKTKFYLAVFSLNIFTDFWILLLPVPMIFQLQMRLRQKLMLCALFGLGAIVCITTVFRMVTLVRLDANDITYSSIGHYGWTSAEISLAFMCACLPVMRPVGIKLQSYASRATHSLSYRSSAKDAPSSHTDSSHPASAGSKAYASHTDRKSYTHGGRPLRSINSLDSDGLPALVPKGEKSQRADAWYDDTVSGTHGKEADVEMGRLGAGHEGKGIQVKREVDVTEEQRRQF